MEAFRNRAPRLRSQSLFNQENVQQLLKILIEGAGESWTYAIFWLSSHEYYPGVSLLGWGDGYYNFYKDEEDKRRGKAPKTALSSAEQEHRKKVIRELVSLIPTPSVSANYLDEEVNETEWFFLSSMTQSFDNGSRLPGHAFFNSSPIWVTGPNRLYELACERARQGHVSGLRTLVCIPSANGVVELASTDVILPNPDLMNKVLDLFNPDPSSSPLIAGRVREGIKEMSDFIYPVGSPRLQVDQRQHHALQSLRRDKSLHERANTEAQNHWNDNLSKQSQGKEKIDDSKCSWSLLSDSSDTLTNSTFSCSHDYSGPS